MPLLEKAMADDDAHLNAGTPPEQVTKIISSETKQPDSILVVQPVSTKGHEVIALRDGFIHGDRKKEGDRFHVPSVEKSGEWMRFVDPKMEEKRLAHYSRKRNSKLSAGE